MNCTHEEKYYLVSCEFCRNFFRKTKHLKKHMKIYHSESKSKTIIEHNLDNNEKKDIDKEFVLQNVEHSVDNGKACKCQKCLLRVFVFKNWSIHHDLGAQNYQINAGKLDGDIG